jgi:hypothetical protein
MEYPIAFGHNNEATVMFENYLSLRIALKCKK